MTRKKIITPADTLEIKNIGMAFKSREK